MQKLFLQTALVSTCSCIHWLFFIKLTLSHQLYGTFYIEQKFCTPVKSKIKTTYQVFLYEEAKIN